MRSYLKKYFVKLPFLVVFGTLAETTVLNLSLDLFVVVRISSF